MCLLCVFVSVQCKLNWPRRKRVAECLVRLVSKRQTITQRSRAATANDQEYQLAARAHTVTHTHTRTGAAYHLPCAPVCVCLRVQAASEKGAVTHAHVCAHALASIMLVAAAGLARRRFACARSRRLRLTASRCLSARCLALRLPTRIPSSQSTRSFLPKAERTSGRCDSAPILASSLQQKRKTK